MSNATAPTIRSAALPAVLPEGACGCASPSWWHEPGDVACHLRAGHSGDHKGRAPDVTMAWVADGLARADCRVGETRLISWAKKEDHPTPCGCRLCSPDAPPSPDVIARVLAKAGPDADVTELTKGGFVVMVPTNPPRKGVRRIIAKAGTLEGLAKLLGA